MSKICIDLDTPVIKKWRKILEKEERKKQREIDKKIMLSAIGNKQITALEQKDVK